MENGKINCKNCGSDNKINSNFCIYCGFKLNSNYCTNADCMNYNHGTEQSNSCDEDACFCNECGSKTEYCLAGLVKEKSTK